MSFYESHPELSYETSTVATRIDGLDVTVAQLREAMDAVQNADHWKGPIDAEVPAELLQITLAAIEFFHADAARQQPAGVQFTDGRGQDRTGQWVARHTDYAVPMNEIVCSGPFRSALLRDGEFNPTSYRIRGRGYQAW